jgi:hypothetical protein
MPAHLRAASVRCRDSSAGSRQADGCPAAPALYSASPRYSRVAVSLATADHQVTSFA